ncbi:MAG: MraY family glycosyltransferase [candidate division WOR-3 bacterium]
MIYFILAFFLSFFLTILFWKISPKIGLLDKPGGIKTHSDPTPYGGGIAIFLGTLIGLLSKGEKEILLFGFLIFLLGLFDDVRPYSRYLKLFFQFLIGIFTVWAGFRMRIVSLPTSINIILSIFWIVGITNAFNIIDVMDGIAAGVGFFSALSFVFISAFGTGNYPIIALTLAGSCLGFLPFNLPKAKIFMGDSGSLFLGYILSVVALITRYSFGNPISIFVPLLILFIPIFDTFYVISLRITKKQNPLRGSHDHFVLKLKASGLPIPSIVAIIYLSTIALCEASFIITLLTFKGAVISYAVGFLIFAFFGIILRGKT